MTSIGGHHRLVPIAAGLGLVGLAAWAFWPLQPLDLNRDDKTLAPSLAIAAPPTAERINLAAFNTPVWVLPPAPPPAPPPTPVADAPPPPPLKIQLIAIARAADGSQSVLVYDPDTDRTIELRASDTIAGRVITAISDNGVHLALASGGVQTLRLSDDTTPGRGGGR